MGILCFWVMRYVVILKIIFLSTQVVSAEDEAQLPSTVYHSHHYKKYFLKGERQSCPDISDDRSDEENGYDYIKFCSLAVIDPHAPMTLTFWGWDQNIGKAHGSVRIDYESSPQTKANKTTIMLSTINVPSNLNSRNNILGVKPQFFKREISLLQYENITNINDPNGRLLLYYKVGGGGHQRYLELRDVWLRPTASDNGAHPPRHCNMGCYVFGIVSCVASCLLLAYCFLILSGRVIDRFIFIGPRIASASVFMLFCFTICSGLLIEYFGKYPATRCKNDAIFMSSTALFLVGICSFVMIRTISMLELGRRQVVPDDTFLIKQQVIQIGRENLKKIKTIQTQAQVSGGGGVTELKIFYSKGDEGGDECPICMLNFDTSADRPGIVTNCGHVWCVDCFINVCKMKPPYDCGTCPSCRSHVKMEEVTLLELEKKNKEEEQSADAEVNQGSHVEGMSTVKSINIRKFIRDCA